jgi:hypothetical protein
VPDFLNDLGVPILLLFFGWLGKGLIKQKMDPEIFFMGPDLILAGVGSSLAHTISYSLVFFYTDPHKSPATTIDGHLISAGKGLVYMLSYILGAMALYLVVLLIHKRFEPAGKGVDEGFRSNRFFCLGFVCDFIGFATLAAVLFLAKKSVI